MVISVHVLVRNGSSQVNAISETIKELSKQSKTVLNSPNLYGDLVMVMQSKMDNLEIQFRALLCLTMTRRLMLENFYSFYQLIQVQRLIQVLRPLFYLLP